MGVMDFLRETGENLAEIGEEAKLAGRIQKRILGLGVNIRELDVDVDGEVVVLKGYAASEKDRHEAVQIAGNVRGIAKVHDKMVIKGEHAETGKHEKHQHMKSKPEKSVKKPRQGGKKVRPGEPAHKNMKHSRSGKRRTP